ncbi:MAG: transcriptional regulator [Sphingomonas sp. 28-66-16]|nr:MAG: transcriptional regulator [Sphingomonas sp. 28-66-16]
MAISAVLIVEDEPLIAMMLEDFLEAIGRRVAGVADSVETGLAIIARETIDAAILDVHLRGGEQSWPIADALAAAGIPFVFASGGSGDSIAERFCDRPVIGKPFSIDSVTRALDSLG